MCPHFLNWYCIWSIMLCEWLCIIYDADIIILITFKELSSGVLFDLINKYVN